MPTALVDPSHSTPEEWLTWILIGALAGTAAGALGNRRPEGFGLILNLVLGLIGAVVGGYVFDRFQIKVGFPTITLDGNHIAAALAGSFAIVLGVAGLKKYNEHRKLKKEQQSGS